VRERYGDSWNCEALASRCVAIEADLDYRGIQREGLPAIEFSFEGSDEGDRISGRGWAILEGEQLRGRIFMHHGDDSGFAACRSANVAPQRRRRRRA
jgi:hypothetical protein